MNDAPGNSREASLEPRTERPGHVTEVFESKTSSGTGQQTTPLFSADEAQGFRSRWDAVQTQFVDEPRKSVQEADNLVESVIQRLSKIFTDERSNLETQWESGDNVSTEDLRLALQRYRSFFTRLLSV
jgi:hypothetical protein